MIGAVVVAAAVVVIVILVSMHAVLALKGVVAAGTNWG